MRYREAIKAEYNESVGENHIIVFRIVDKHGYGYKRELDSKIFNAIDVDWEGYDSRRPLPHQDGIDIQALDDKWFFGFADIAQYKSWFNLNERNAGTFFEGKLEEIAVRPDAVIHGKKQVVFQCEHAKLVNTHMMNAFDSDEDKNKPFMSKDYEEDEREIENEQCEE